MATEDCSVVDGVCTRHTANNPTCVAYEGIENPNRTLSLPEVDALITIEAVERLMVNVHRLLTPEHGDEGVDENTRLEAQCLLESAIDLTTTRTATAVKRQGISDSISYAARVKVQIATADVDARMRPLREPKKVEKGVWRHADDGTPCVSYPDSFDFTYYAEVTIPCSVHGRPMACHRKEVGTDV